jgi:hypothetical protein
MEEWRHNVRSDGKDTLSKVMPLGRSKGRIWILSVVKEAENGRVCNAIAFNPVFGYATFWWFGGGLFDCRIPGIRRLNVDSPAGQVKLSVAPMLTIFRYRRPGASI